MAGVRRARLIVAGLMAVAVVMVFAAPALADTGSISGTATAVVVGGGCPVAGGCNTSVTVQAFSLPGDAPVGSSVETDGSGNYTISGLAPGSYAVGFQRAGFADQYYNDESSLAAANPVTVTSGATTTGINATLQPPAPGSISGNVIAAGTGPGRQLSDIAIEATGGSAPGGGERDCVQ